MNPATAIALKPRKQPVQRRSSDTVAAVFEATIQVLLRDGFDRLTTTRVAERAGVSVGTLYQYFPNKNALIAAVHQRHLDDIVSVVETACIARHGNTLYAMMHTICNTFIDAKTKHLDVSRALYRPAAELGSKGIVHAARERLKSALVTMLHTANDHTFGDLELPAMVMINAIIAPLHAVMELGADPKLFNDLRSELVDLCVGYLGRIAVGDLALTSDVVGI
jgi:AcrR family transcriptional regulator